MNDMKIVLLLLSSYLLMSCSDGIEHSYFDDPFSGKRMPAKTASIDDWAITIIDGEMLLLRKAKERKAKYSRY